MARRLRWLPPAENHSASTHPVAWSTASGRVTVEITASTVRGTFLLRPSRRLRAITIGVLAKAQKLTGAEIHAFCYLSTHMHALGSFENVWQMARFMAFLQSNLAKEVCVLTDWKDRVWARRYRSTVLSQETEVIGRRLRYILEQGCKEKLVLSPLDWPGASSVGSIVRGNRTIGGLWVDRTAFTNARKNRRTRGVSEERFTHYEAVRLSPPPGFEDWQTYVDWTRGMVALIEADTVATHERAGSRPLGVDAILAMEPFHIPDRQRDRSCAPLVFASSKPIVAMFRAAFNVVTAAYRDVAERLRVGNLAVAFPEGTFPPPRPIRFMPLRS
jgi:hypothetical protein